MEEKKEEEKRRFNGCMLHLMLFIIGVVLTILKVYDIINIRWLYVIMPFLISIGYFIFCIVLCLGLLVFGIVLANIYGFISVLFKLLFDPIFKKHK